MGTIFRSSEHNYSSLTVLRHILSRHHLVNLLPQNVFNLRGTTESSPNDIPMMDSADSHRDPQNMGSPPKIPTGNSPVWVRQQRRKGAFQKLLYIAIVFLTVFVFMAISFRLPLANELLPRPRVSPMGFVKLCLFHCRS